MVNLADLDTSFLVPCRHCGDLLPEQDRICPHCGKDQSVLPAKGGADAGPSGVPLGGGNGLDPLAAARGTGDFTGIGIGSHVADDGSARRRRKAIGIVALLVGVLLLGMAYDRHAKRSATSPPGPTPTLAQEAPVRPATITPPAVRTPSAAAPVAPVAATSTAMPSPTPPAPPSNAAAPVPAETPSSGCSEALAALSLCAQP